MTLLWQSVPELRNLMSSLHTAAQGAEASTHGSHGADVRQSRLRSR